MSTFRLRLVLVAAILFGVAVMLHLPWELAHFPLFTCQPRNVFVRCLVASLGDGVLTLVIHAAGWLWAGTMLWFRTMGAREYLFIAGTALVIAVAVELLAVRLLRRWEYSGKMPLVPGLGVGISPLLQLTILSPIVFAISTWLARASGAM